MVSQHASARARPNLPGQVRTEDVANFGTAKAVNQLDRCQRSPSRVQRLRQRLACRDGQSHACKWALRRALQCGAQLRIGRWNREEQRGPKSFDGLEGVGDVWPLWGQNAGSSSKQGQEE